MRIALLLWLLAAAGGERTLVFPVGGNVTLPCNYDRGSYGVLTGCWGRGQLPNNGCGRQLLAFGQKGTDPKPGPDPGPGRYRLLGRLEEGDVSMTIVNLTAQDAGRYGCRVEIPGPFNDLKVHFELLVTGPEATPTEATPTWDTPTPGTNQTEGDPLTSSPFLDETPAEGNAGLRPQSPGSGSGPLQS
ncbi:hepatitis A virus cellular receptor 1 homolog isoform 4-T4 [Menidia menidia]